MERPSISETMFELAYAWRKRSTCLRGQVGCVAASPDGRVLASGYNGAPHGMAHCLDVGCLMEAGHCIRSLHAEMNLIITAGRFGVSLVGAIVYTTTRPCLRCTVALIQAGVKGVVYDQPYHTDDPALAMELLSSAGITVIERR